MENMESKTPDCQGSPKVAFIHICFKIFIFITMIMVCNQFYFLTFAFTIMSDFLLIYIMFNVDIKFHHVPLSYFTAIYTYCWKLKSFSMFHYK